MNHAKPQIRTSDSATQLNKKPIPASPTIPRNPDNNAEPTKEPHYNDGNSRVLTSDRGDSGGGSVGERSPRACRRSIHPRAP
jgi:hypothetical protein